MAKVYNSIWPRLMAFAQPRAAACEPSGMRGEARQSCQGTQSASLQLLQSVAVACGTYIRSFGKAIKLTSRSVPSYTHDWLNSKPIFRAADLKSPQPS